MGFCPGVLLADHTDADAVVGYHTRPEIRKKEHRAARDRPARDRGAREAFSTQAVLPTMFFSTRRRRGHEVCSTHAVFPTISFRTRTGSACGVCTGVITDVCSGVPLPDHTDADAVGEFHTRQDNRKKQHRGHEVSWTHAVLPITFFPTWTGGLCGVCFNNHTMQLCIELHRFGHKSP